MRSALYLDFDNVFSGLMQLDPRSALQFAESPSLWLNRLADGSVNQPPRRWLVLRCYMNPAGGVPHPDNNGNRLVFSRFRPYFTDAGFEVVDCPRLSHTKNGADIRLVVDAVDALRADVRYEEFVIASGDSDMTPLIVRLRASDRRITLVSPSDSAVVLGAVADRLIGGEELMELLDTPPTDPDCDPDDGDAPRTGPATGDTASAADARARFRSLVLKRYAQASEPINLSGLAHELREELGPVTVDSRWLGHGSFLRALQALDIPGVRVWQHYLWDSRRHTAPETGPAAGNEAVPESLNAVARVTRVLKIPQLPTASWRSIYQSLAAFVAAYEFNLSEATRWARDRLAEKGVRGPRQAVGLVAHGSAYGGCVLYRQPPPSAAEIGAAFVRNVLDRAAAADVELSPQEVQQIRRWLGDPELGAGGRG